MSAIFLVGPGGVGKSTVAAVLAELTGRPWQDLVDRFIAEFGEISRYIDERGYRGYCEANAALAQRIVDDEPSGHLILAASSGFLVHDGCDDIVERNLSFVRSRGASVLLLPSRDVDTAARVIAFRQVHRYPQRDLIAEYTIGRARCARYMVAADAVVLADAPPAEVARRVMAALHPDEIDLSGRRPGGVNSAP